MFSSKIGQIEVSIDTKTNLHAIICQTISTNGKEVVLHANARLIELANTSDKWLIDYLDCYINYVFCDGAGIQLAAKITGQPIPEKITYNTWFWEFSELCTKRQFSIFLLGAKPDVVQKAAANLQKHSPTLKLNYHHGYFNKKNGAAENEDVVERINAFKPNVLLVCFGMPEQERWIKDNFHRLQTNVLLTGGGALDYISGQVKTTPQIFKSMYLEWLYRVAQNPRRLFVRYLISNLVFGKIVLSEVFKKRITRK